ncbi:hypothetical protein WJX82_000522 [Trebouxia sp. C0006]
MLSMSKPIDSARCRSLRFCHKLTVYCSFRMASLAPLQEVQQEIKAVLEKVSELETSLAAAKQAGDDDEVRFLRDRLVQLDRERVVLREKENKLMVVQSGGQSDLQAKEFSPPASIKFVWTGDEDTTEEVERLKLRLQALTGWEDFPSDLELRDVHMQMSFDVRIEDECHRVLITSKSDIAMQHTYIEPGGFMLEDTFLLVEAKKDLSQGALKAAEAKAYMQYVAFESAAHRHVPVLLTDGNIMVLYTHNTKLNAHQRMYWDFGQILDASLFLEELVKQIALNNPLMRGYIPGQDDQPDSPEAPGTGHRGPSTCHVKPSLNHDECEQNDKDTPWTNVEQHHGTSRTATSMSLGQRHCLTEMQDADRKAVLTLRLRCS